MTQIHVLDDTTINKIAAGEVVERPASVVKELVENAMDAGATAIEIEIMGGGVSFIRVTDNGHGMTREDARTAILRHATSKISSVSDLQTVATLGFRPCRPSHPSRASRSSRGGGRMISARASTSSAASLPRLRMRAARSGRPCASRSFFSTRLHARNF